MSQSTIDFLLNNNVTIIQVIFGIIFILVVFVILRSFKEDKTETRVAPAPSSAKSRREEFKAEKAAEEKKAAELPKEESPLDDLDNLDDLMGPDTTQGQIDQAMTAVAPAAPASQQSSDNGELAAALSEKEKVISDLKSELASLQEKLKAPAAAATDNSGLESKVKELTEKLAEYEIIEDDIANLSFYKNENVKLKNELAKLKGDAGVAIEAKAPEAPAPVIKEAPPVPTEPINDESVLNEFEEAVKQKEALEKSMPEKDTVAPPIPMKSDADLLKEFESAVEKEMGPGAIKPSANTKTAPPETKEAPKAEAPKPETPKSEDAGSNTLVAEIEALAKATPPESKDDGKDSNQKLIEEFENFVNKN